MLYARSLIACLITMYSIVVCTMAVHASSVLASAVHVTKQYSSADHNNGRSDLHMALTGVHACCKHALYTSQLDALALKSKERLFYQYDFVARSLENLLFTLGHKVLNAVAFAV